MFRVKQSFDIRNLLVLSFCVRHFDVGGDRHWLFFRADMFELGWTRLLIQCLECPVEWIFGNHFREFTCFNSCLWMRNVSCFHDFSCGFSFFSGEILVSCVFHFQYRYWYEANNCSIQARASKFQVQQQQLKVAEIGRKSSSLRVWQARCSV